MRSATSALAVAPHSSSNSGARGGRTISAAPRRPMAESIEVVCGTICPKALL